MSKLYETRGVVVGRGVCSPILGVEGEGSVWSYHEKGEGGGGEGGGGMLVVTCGEGAYHMLGGLCAE